MSDPVQLAPTMAIFEDDGEFTVRVNDSPLAKSLTPALLKAIGEMTKAKKLTLLTPVDTKIFRLNGLPQAKGEPVIHEVPVPVPPRARISQDESAPPAPELAEEAIDEYDKALAEAKKAEQEIAQMERMNRQDANIADGDDGGVSSAPRSRKRTPRPEPIPDATCGRCQGSGSIEGGGACPVCRGKGAVAHFGRGRR